VSSQPSRVAVDLETTGLLTEQDSIIEIGAIKFAGDEVLDTFESFVAARQPLPYRVQRLTGIRPADLAGAPSLADLAPRLRAFLGDLPLVGHSVPFDAAFLRRIGLARRNPLVDTYELASALLPDLPSYTLEAVGAALGVASPTHHRALPDAMLARDIFLALLRRLDALDPGIVSTLGRLSEMSDWTPAYFIRSALRASARSSRSGIGWPAAGLTGTLGDQLSVKLGLDPAVLALAVAREDEPVPAASSSPPPIAGAPLPADVPADEAPVDAQAAGEAQSNRGSALPAPDAARHDERAPELQAAAVLIATCVAHGGAAALELDLDAESMLDCVVPLLDHVVRTGQRAIVAAADAARAARIAREYVPAALTRLGLPADRLAVAEVGEESAYFCLHRWFGAATLPRGGALPRELVRGLAKLAVWSTTTRTGRRGEVSLSGLELQAWERSRAGREFRESVAGCAYHKHGYCFVARAEQSVQSADVVVTTHAGLAEHLAGRGKLLSQAERVLVLDAHLLEDELRRVGSWSVERKALVAMLASLADAERGGTRAGLLHVMAERRGDAPEAAWFAQVARARAAADAFFAALGRLQTEGQHGGARGRKGGEASETGEQAVRLNARARRMDAWPEVERGWAALEARLRGVARLVGEVAEGTAPSRAGKRAFAADGVATDLLAIRRTIEEMCVAVADALASEHVGTVHWLRTPHAPAPRPGAAAEQAETSANPGVEPPTLHAAATEVGGMLAPLLAPDHALVLVGSALAAGGEFEHTLGALGLRPEDIQTLVIAPDRTAQTLLVLPEDAAEPNTPAYQRNLDEALVALGTTLAGRLIVIFPSHAALRAASAGIKRSLERHDVLVLAQGVDGSARQLWQTFRSQPRIALLGAGTFWDGADLAGTPPACVVVARLPFPSLSDPLLAARSEAWQDPQTQFVVPHAALKLRQALNGLVWSHHQRNAVVLFDRRVLSRAYGPTVLATLPRCTVRHERLADLAEQVAAWVDGAAVN
jgi:ATP-dependent DNA helicase DinG